MSESMESSAVPQQDGAETVVTTTASAADNKVNATTSSGGSITVTATTSLKNAGGSGNNASSSNNSAPSNSDNLVIVFNKIESDKGGGGESGNVKVLPKTVTVVNSPATATTAGAAVKKTAVLGGTIVKMQKSGLPMNPPLGKRQVVIASRPGVNQIITCGSAVQQTAHGSTPVILTQKVASGGVVTSPVVSTGGVNAGQVTNISGLGGNAKIVTTTSAQASQQQRFQDVRVDNWGNYCLQRLQGMYDRGDFCDLTLRFHSSQEIKVHRVVVNLCTEYFSNLEKLYGLNEGTLILPKDVEFQTMQTIIKFFYTGKLEVRGTHFTDIYRTVKMMNITILIKLLEAHSRKPAPTQIRKEAGRSVVLKQAVDLGKGQKGQVQIQVATGQHHQSASPVIAVAGSKALQVAAPGVKLPPGVKTKTVLARVQPQTGKSQSQVPGKSTPKKLPIWKERKFTTQDHPPLEKWQIKEEEPARPTRFEWGDPDEPDPFLSSTLTNHALMEKQKEKHSTRKVEDIFDSVKSQTQSQGVKRPPSQPGSSSAEPPAAKIPKLDIVTASSTEIIIPESSSSSDALNSLNLNENTIIEEVTTSPPETKPVERKPIPILKPALKSSSSKTMKGPGTSDKGTPGSGKDGSPQKTVRFAPEVEKENKEKPTSTAPPLPQPQLTPVTTKVEVPVSSNDGGDPLVNHSKIISEVLRKFPDLVKDNKNIKLKIVTKPMENSSTASSSKETKSKVSYILLKSSGGTDSTTSTVLKKSPAQTSVSKFWETDKTPKKPSPAENTTGPWLCETCGEGENTALQFDTYYNFRRHLVDVHAERIDARICEYCGQKASKRNLLLYHMYTKHGVQPPKNCTFPHCDRCDYVALSESLLKKHQQNHDVNKEFSCSICNASFKSSTALQGHMSANLHRNKDTKVYECPYCRKPFVRNINLKAHIRSLHRDVARFEEMEDPRLPLDESLTHRIIATSTSKKRQFPSILTAGRGSSNTSLVEFLTADNLHDGQTVSYVTADGHPIEIIDPSQLSSLPLTLVSSEEDGMGTVATPMGTTLSLEGQSTADAEYVTGVAQDGSQAVYVMDGSQGAVEIDMANMGLTLSADGTMIYEGDDASQHFIVQDMQGNQFRRMAGIDPATGKPVVYLHMLGEGEQVEMSPVVLDESMTVDESGGNSQMFVSSSGMTIPVTSDGTTGQQVIFASTSADGTILEMVPADSESHQVMSEAELAAHQQINEQTQHLQLVDHGQSAESIQEVIHDEMGQPVQELHIVLDGQDNNGRHESPEPSQEEVLDIVEVRQSEEYITDSTHGELQLGEAYSHSVIQQEHDHEDESVEDTSIEEIHEHDDVMTQEISETQQIEIDEGDSNQLQIHEEDHNSMEDCETQEMEVDSQETQIITADNLEESIELVEGQTLTLIEEEDGTQTLKVDNSVEEITS